MFWNMRTTASLKFRGTV
uniref:Uncharacterized protein n=1 Tax=Arundo donax TaxID=35708 RepID=A0A0A8Z3M0_ARUDO